MPGVIEEADALFGVDPLIHEADAIFGVGGNQPTPQPKPPFELRMSTNGPPPAQGLANVPPEPTSAIEREKFLNAVGKPDPAVSSVAAIERHQRIIPPGFTAQVERLRREKPEQFNRLLRSALNSAGNIWGTGDQPATGSKRQLILAARNLNAPLTLIPQVVAAMAGGTREDGPEWAKTILADVEAEGVVGKASGWDKVADGLNEVGSFLMTFGLGGPANPQKTAQTLATGSKFARGVEKGLSAVRMFATPFQAAGAAENVAAKLLPVRAEGRLYRMAGKLRDTVAAVFGFSAAHNLGEAAKGKESVVDAMAATLRAPKDAISDALATVYELPSMVREAKTPEGVQRMIGKIQNAAMILLPIANSARRWRAPVPPPGPTQPEPPVFSAKDLADPANADQFVRVYPQQAEMLAATPTISRGAFAKLFGMPKDFARVDSVADRKTASQSVAAAIERAKVARGVREQLAQGNVTGAKKVIADSRRLTNPPAPPPPPAEPVYPLVPGEKLRRLRNAVGRKALSVDAVDAKVRSIGSQQAFKDSGLYTTDSIVDQYARALASRLPVSAVSQPEVAKGNVAAPAQPTETSNGKIERQGQEKEVLLNSPDSNVAAPPAGTTPEPTASEGGARPLESRVTKVGKFWKVSDADGAIYPFEFKSQEQAVATIGALEKQLGDVPGKTGSDVPSDQRNPAQPVGGIPNGGREPGVPSDVPATSSLRSRADSWESDALKTIQSKGATLRSGLDPELLAAYVKYGAAQVLKGTAAVADFTKHMIDRFGEEIRPQIDGIWQESKKLANRYGKPEPTSIVDDSVAAIGGVADEIKSAFAPATRGDAAKLTAQSMRAGLARQTQLRGSTEAAFAKATRAADKLSPPEQIKYYAALEKGAPTGDSKFDKAAAALREMTDQWWSKVQAIKGGPERWIENYWARYWDLSQPGAKNTFDRVYGKRPLEGPKTFNRQRKIPTVQDGIDAGLKLAETNPLRAAQAKIFEMQRYVTAHEILRELKAAGLVKYVKGMSRGPDGYQPINDSLFTQFGRGKGTTILRRLWMPEPAAKIINNYLSQGLAGSTTYQLFRAAGNTMNQVQLGMSAFHAAFTTLDAMISTSASGLMKLESGARNLSPAEMLGGVAKLAEGATPLAAIRNVVRGRRMFKALRSDLSSLPDGPLKDQAQAIIEGGGRAAMDSFYHNNQLGKFLRAMKEGRFGAAAARSPLALVEAIAWPIMERLVPYQKLGVASELARIELERLGPEASKDQIREAMGRAWDSVDNRLGQMVYDNLFWNKTLKDIGMISVRSLGWNLGTIRELGGAIKDVPGAVGRARSGDRIVTPRMAYAMVLPATVGLYGAIYGYLHGQKPEEMKDYFYPKTGKVNPDGSPERVSLPSYIKDIYAYSKHPITTVGHKLHPLIAATVEMINNQDYFGTKIRNEDDPAVKQVAASAKHIGEQFIPFSVRNAMKRKEAGGSFKEQAESFLGITPATREMERSDAQNVLAEHYAAQRPVGGRTQEAADKSKARRDLIEEARKDAAGVRTKLIQSIKSGSMSRDQALDVLRSAKLPAGESSIKYAPLDVALKAFRVATPAERDQWGKAVALKLMRAIKTMPRDQWNEHAREAIDLNVPIPDRTKKAILKRLGN